MKRTLLTLALGTAVAVAAGISLAHTGEHGEAVNVISNYEIKEKLNDKDTSVTVVEVTIEPGQQGLPHRHPGPAFVYVLEGEYELGIDDQRFTFKYQGLDQKLTGTEGRAVVVKGILA